MNALKPISMSVDRPYDAPEQQLVASRDTIDLQWLLAVLRRRFWLFLGVATVVFLAVAAYVLLATKEYTATAQVMATLSYLSDVIGPRLTGSPNLKRANEWTRDKLAAWGLANAHLEAWGPFGRGWTLKRFSAQVISPQCIPLIGYPKAWSPGTDGTLEAPVVYFDAKSEAEFAKFKDKLKGAIVLMSPIREVAAHYEAERATALVRNTQNVLAAIPVGIAVSAELDDAVALRILHLDGEHRRA